MSSNSASGASKSGASGARQTPNPSGATSSTPATDTDEETWSLKIEHKEIWRGKATVAPTLRELSNQLKQRIGPNNPQADNIIADLSAQIIRSCPPKYIPALLSALSCHFHRNEAGDIDVNLLLQLPSTGMKPVCGMVFKKGDLAWNCRTCGKDQTCVQCEKCFRNSNHEGHEVFFHRSSGDGGCCDCGDPEAWSPAGNCCLHCGVTDDDVLKPSLDAIDTVPPALTRGLRNVLLGAFGTTTSFATAIVRAYQPFAMNPFVRWVELFDLEMSCRLHDDEVHTYAEVTSCLKRMGVDDQRAEQCTVSVDKLGEAVVMESSDIEKLRKANAHAQNDNLLFSMIPQGIMKLEPSVVAFLNWALSIGNGNHIGLRSIITEMLMKDMSAFPAFASVIDSEESDVDSPELKSCMESVAPNNIFNIPDQFPSIIPQLVNDPKATAGGAAVGGNDELTIFWSKAIAVFGRPFDNCPRTPFSILTMASPFLSKAMKSCLSTIVIYFQHDSYFKFCFSQIFMLLYPALYALYVRFLGIHNGNIFNTSVQLFTANSIVDNLSSDGFAQRLFPEKEPRACLTNILVQMLKSSLSHMGCHGPRNISKMFLMHPSLRNYSSSRLTHLFRDIDYVLKSPIACTRILADERDVGMFSELMEVYATLQQLDRFRRRVTTHVERENDRWSTAINLLLEVEGITTDLVSHAFFPFISSNAAWGYTNDVSIIKPVTTTTTTTTTTDPNSQEFSRTQSKGLLLALQKVLHVIDFYFGESRLEALRRERLAAERHSSNNNGATTNARSSFGELSSSLSSSLSAATSQLSTLTGFNLNNNNNNNTAGAAPPAATPPKPLTAKSSEDEEDDGDDELFFFPSTDPIQCLGQQQRVHFPGIRHYKVSSNSVSINIPLQRVVAKLFTFASMGGMDLAEALLLLREYPAKAALHSLPDLPLRCLSFAAQVNCTMWRRNGYAIASLAFNYGRPIFSKTFRLADLHAVQVSVLTLGADAILALSMDRFEVDDVLENPAYFKSKDALRDYKGDLLAEYLKLLSNLVVYLPCTLVDETSATAVVTSTTETLRLAVAREVVHHVLVGEAKKDELSSQVSIKPVSFGKLLRVKNVVATPKHVSEALVKSISEEFCTQRHGGGDEEESGGFELNAKGFELIDPNFGSWSSEDQQKASEAIRDFRKRKESNNKANNKTQPVYLPVVSMQALPFAHRQFEAVRALLFRPLLLTILDRSLRLCLDKDNLEKGLNKSVAKVVSQVLQLVTLQIHVHRMFAAQAAANNNNNNTSTSHNEIVEAVNVSQFFFSHFFNEQPLTIDDNNRHVGCGASLLASLAELWNNGVTKDDDYSNSGLGWILSELSANSDAAKHYLESVNIVFGGKDSAGSKDKKTLAQKKAEAQQKALAAMNKQAKQFSFGMESDDDSDNDNDKQQLTNADGSAATTTKKVVEPTLEDGASECILCRDKCNEVMGYLCYIQPSKGLRNAIMHSSNNNNNNNNNKYVDEPVQRFRNQFRVVSVSGATVHQKASHQSVVVATLKQGQHVQVKQRVGVWMELEQPSGWVAQHIPNNNNNNNNNANNNINSENTSYKPQLHPVTDLLFSKHGDTRVHVSSCGHMMHLKCWDGFRAKTHNLSSSQIDIATERVCPFCKGICNSLLPHIPPHVARLQSENNNNGDGSGSGSSVTLLSLLQLSAEAKDPQQARQLLSQAIAPLLTSNSSSNNNNTLTVVSPAHAALLSTDVQRFSSQVLSQFHLSWMPGADTYMDALEAVEPLKRLRCLHSLWSSVAYTVLCYSLTENQGKLSEAFEAPTESRSKDWKTHLLCSQLLLSSLHQSHATAQPATLMSLQLLLSGARSTLLEAIEWTEASEQQQQQAVFSVLNKFKGSKSDFVKMLSSLPFTVVGNSVMPSKRRLSLLLQLLYEKAVVSTEDLWAFLSLPLLAHDLHVVAVATASLSADRAALRSSLGLLCLARLTQALVEPISTGILHNNNNNSKSNSAAAKAGTSVSSSVGGVGVVADGASLPILKRQKSESSSTATAASTANDNNNENNSNQYDEHIRLLTELRAVVCAELGLTMKSSSSNSDGGCLEGESLLLHALDSWTPFLEFIAAVHERLSPTATTTTVPDAPATTTTPATATTASSSLSLSGLLLRVESLLSALSLPSLASLLKERGLTAVAVCWANQYRLAYSVLPRFHENNNDNNSNVVEMTGAEGAAAGVVLVAEENSLASRSSTVESSSSPPAPLTIHEALDMVLAPDDEDNNNNNVVFPTAATALHNLNGLNDDDEMDFSQSSSGNGDDDDDDAVDEDDDVDVDVDVNVDLEMPMDALDVNPAAAGENLDNILQQLGLIPINDENNNNNNGGVGDEGGNGNGAGNNNNNINTLVNGFAGGNITPEALAAFLQPHNPLLLGGSGGGLIRSMQAAQRAAAAWKMVGVDPSFAFIDEAINVHELFNIRELNHIHSFAPFMGSLTAQQRSVGLAGATVTEAIADMSHLGIRKSHRLSLIDLPNLYTDIYHRAKFPEGEEHPLEEPCVCLMCGRVLNAGNKNADDAPSAVNPGECTLHARSCGGGTGAFFLVQHYSVLLVHGAYSSYFPSLYLDANGETDRQKNQNRPMYLSERRYNRVKELHAHHLIPLEIARNRTTKNSFIRLNWY